MRIPVKSEQPKEVKISQAKLGSTKIDLPKKEPIKTEVLDVSKATIQEIPEWNTGMSQEEWIKALRKYLEPRENGLYVNGSLKSSNFVRKVKGWGTNVNKDGDAYFVDGYFAGTFTIGGATKTVGAVADIQSALDEVDASGGGTVFLKAGTYVLTADITVPSGCTLEGVSRDDVIIDCNSSYKIQVVGSNAYSTGTVTINTGDTEVVGSGTTWTSAMVGRYIMISGNWYLITVFTDTTHLNIDPAYFSSNVAGASYVIADVCFATTIKKMNITNATGAGLKLQYDQETILDDIIIYSCGTGLDVDDSVYMKLLASIYDCSVNLDMNNAWGWFIDFCAFTNSTTGAGVEMVNSGSGTFFDSTVEDNFGNGISLTDCSNIAFISNNTYSNGDNGIELISGNTDIQLISLTADGNTNDGIKFTATSDRNIIISSSIINNGGYGINIAASTCDNNQIIAVAYDNNTSGNLNNSGTKTIQLYATIASDTLRDSADTERTTTSTTYVKVKEIVFNEVDGTVRTKFDLRLNGAANTAYGRIYKNGVAYGTEQTQTLNSTYTTFSEDLAFKTGDLIQLYYHQTAGGSSASVRNFRLYYDKVLVTNTGTVNTD